MKVSIRVFLAAALAVAGMSDGWTPSAAAQGAPSIEEVPPHIPTSAFASRTQLSGARLAPDGEHFAFVRERDGTTFIIVFDADTREFVDGVNLGEEQEFNFFRWAGSRRLVFSMTSTDRYNYRYSRLYYYDFETGVMHPLTARRMEFDGDDIVHIDPDGDFILTSFGMSWRDPPSVWRFNLDGGPEAPEPVRIEGEQTRTTGWIADNTGAVRIALGSGGYGRARMRYRSTPDQDWDTVAEARIDEEDALELWDFMGLRAGTDMGFSIGVPEGGERRVLMEFNFLTGQPGEIVFSSPDEDVSSVYFDDDNNPIAVGYYGDSFRREWLDPEIDSWRTQLAGALEGRWVTILDITPDRSRMLILESGPADPGALYVFTPAERRLDLFTEYRPAVPPSLLVEPESIRFDARDGTSIHAYLTLPKGRAPEGLPLIVYPHGGPYGIRDSNNYNDTVQLLANRGYAVIQPNYRGSGGYGEAFEDLGWGQIGRAMQDDLDDAVAHLVEQGTVDPERVCMIGGSYGGFASAWAVIRNPEIYRCAASWAGVMHFERQLSHDRDYLWGRNRGRWADRVDGDQTNFDLDDVSPAVQVARLTRPLLLAHGEEDSRVPFNQFELMVSRAERAEVEIETLRLAESGHSFSSEEDELAWYDALTAFLMRHNPPD